MSDGVIGGVGASPAPPLAGIGRAGSSPSFAEWLHKRWGYLALSPAVLVILLLMVIPIINILVMSFHVERWADGAVERVFVGLDNFRQFSADPIYWVGLRNTLVFAAIAVLLQLIIGFGLALLVSGMKRGRTALVAILLIPIILPPIIIGAIWRLVLNFDLGILNVTLGALGLPAVDWLGDPRLALGAVIAVDVWHWTPFVFLLLLAGLESLPAEQYEAAALDGATRWQQFRYLTVPLMWPTIMITLVFRIVFSFKVFDEIYLLTRGGPGTSTEVVSYTIYRTYLAEDRAGVGSVMSLFTVAVIAISAIIVINLRRRKAAA